ncbi:MAG: ATP-binding protein [Lachnospiraceae bacterium]|nr:ATP-binding protein [Lachnospiraceae bacterium]
MMIYNALKYLARYKKFVKTEKQEAQAGTEAGTDGTAEGKEKKKASKNAAPKAKSASYRSAGKHPDVAAITPFTGISDGFIEYGGQYYAAVVEIPSIEFRFMTLSKQNNMIDKVFGSVLRTVVGSETASMVKIDRPIIYDDFIRSEEQKIAELKEAFINDLINEEELTDRIAIIYDRIEQIKKLNYEDKVYVPFHYLVFYDKDRTTLRDQTHTMINVFAGNDMECRRLNDKELAVFLKYNYTLEFDEREVEKLKPEEYMDWILPKKIEFAARTIKYDDLYTHTLRITDYPTQVGNAWGHQMFNLPSTRVNLKMKPIDRYKAVRRIDRAIDELRGQGGATGRTSKLIELSNHIDTLSELLTLLQNDNETMFDINIYVTIYDYEMSKRMLEPKTKKSMQVDERPSISIKKQIKRTLAEGNFKSIDMFAQQFEAYASSQISAYDAFTAKSRGIHSTSIAAAFPYVYSMLCDKEGVMIGRTGGRPVFVNFFQRDKERVNSNMVVIGKSGSGKSFATKTLLANLAAEDSKIFILDPENEYTQLAHNLDGKVIDVGSATQGRLNPFHIIMSMSDEEGDEDVQTSFNMHLQFLEEFYRQILPGIDSDALEYLNNLTIRMYESKGIDADTDLSKLKPEDYPIFDDLYDKILNDYQFSSGEYSKANLRVLLNYISKFATGGRNSSLWNGEASISTNENFIVFNFQSLLANKNNTVANAQMLLVLKWLDNEIIKNRDYNMKYGAKRKIIVVIDEAHVFIDEKYPIALDFMYQLAKRIRKYNGMQIIITQNIKDFVGTEEIARKSTAIINACQYSLIFPLAPNDMIDLCKLYEKAGAINESEQEEIVNNGRGRAFVITSPSSRTCIDIVATEEVQEMFTM